MRTFREATGPMTSLRTYNSERGGGGVTAKEEYKAMQLERNPGILEHLGDLGRRVTSRDGLAFAMI